MVGGLVFLIVLGFLAVVGMVALWMACWLANAILGTRPPQPALLAQVTGPTPVYRTVDAGPYTSPTTGHDGPTGHDARADGIPTPTFFTCFAITALTGLIGGFTLAGLLFFMLFMRVSPGGNADELGLLLLVIVALVTAAIHAVLLVMLLPTTFPRAALVTAIEALPMGLLLLLLLGMAFWAVPVRSGPVRTGPPPTATSSGPPAPAP